MRVEYTTLNVGPCIQLNCIPLVLDVQIQYHDRGVNQELPMLTVDANILGLEARSLLGRLHQIALEANGIVKNQRAAGFVPAANSIEDFASVARLIELGTDHLHGEVGLAQVLD